MTIGERKLHVEPAPDEAQFDIKVAFVTQDRQRVDQHFGTAKGVLIYGVSEQSWSLLEAIEYPIVSEQTHAKLPGRITDLKGCAAVYCNACGAAAIRQLLADEINPVRVSEGSDIHQLISELQLELRGTPMGWLGRALKQAKRECSNSGSQADRLNALMDEDW